MRITLSLVAAAGLALSTSAAGAQTRPAHPAAKPAAKPANANAPKSIGKFDDWQAATHLEAGQPVCYAFTRAQSSLPNTPGRGDVVLTVTQRPGGRDAVAISAGLAFAQGAEVTVSPDNKGDLSFYTSGRSAFARDGHAVTVAFANARQAVAKVPGPKGTVTDTFPLRGFAPAYAAINKACPAK